MSINKLDQIDWKILAGLKDNARLSYSNLAKKVKISKQAVKNRIDRLVSTHVITQFITFINMGNLGITPYKVYLKLKNISSERKSELIEYFGKREAIGILTLFDGSFDLYIGVMTHHPRELDQELQLLYEEFADYIIEHKVVSMIDTQILPRDYLLKEKRSMGLKPITFHSPKKSAQKLTETDQQILGILKNEPLLSSSEISRRLKTSVQTVINRIKYMEKEGIITGYGYLLNENMFVSYLILIQLNSLSKEVQRRVISFLQMQSNVILLVKTIGNWDYEIGIEAKELKDARSCMTEIKETLAPELKSFTPLLVNRMINIKNYVRK